MEKSYVDSTAETQRMAKHVRGIANVSLFFGSLWLVGIIFALLTTGQRVGGLGFPELVTTGIFGLPLFCIGIGLWKCRPWGRIIALIFAVVTIVSPVAWYVLWVLTRPASKELFTVRN